jgi:hypothetical protein
MFDTILHDTLALAKSGTFRNPREARELREESILLSIRRALDGNPREDRSRDVDGKRGKVGRIARNARAIGIGGFPRGLGNVGSDRVGLPSL